LLLVRWPFTLNCPGLLALAGVLTTPGLRAISDWKLLPLSGMVSTKRRSTAVPRAAVSSNPASAITVTASSVCASFSGRVMARESLTFSVNPSARARAKPGAAVSTR
jgi:hypothetical protein